MACKHKGKVRENGWCNVACSYCTATQEANCEHNRQTNGDRIRAMSNKELAWFLAERYANESVLRVRDLGHNPTATEIKMLTETLYHTWLRWMIQPVEDE